MDHNEYEIVPNGFNRNTIYSDDIEFVIEQLNHMAHAAGRYDRTTQIPIAIKIVKKLKEMQTEK